MEPWLSARIDPVHRLDQFDCGRASLNSWLRVFALRADTQGTARTLVWTHPDEPTVVGYYSIAPTEIRREGLSRAAHGGRAVCSRAAQLLPALLPLPVL